MITSRNIANIGSPLDDLTCPLPGILWIPDPALFPGPYPCVVMTESPGFSDDVGLNLPSRTAQSMAGVGFLALAFQCRVDGPLQSPPTGGIPGQTTDGGYHQQTDDCKIAVRYMRPGAEIETVQGFTVTGSVGAVGGSGSGHHALYLAVFGTPLDDKADWAIGFSPPTDFGDRSAEVLARPPFITKVEAYGRGDGSSDPADLADLTSKSTIAGDLANASAIRHYNGTGESMPVTQLTGFRDAIVAAGNTKYVSIIIDDPQFKAKHSWGILQAVPNVATDCNQWALEQAALFDGNPPPPPPPPPPPGSQVKVTAAITGMLPGTPMVLTVIPTDTVTGLDGPPEIYSFISDPAGIIGDPPPPPPGKSAPAGVYALIDAVDGVPVGQLSTRAWWGFSYVDGGRLPTTWSALNPTSRTTFTWAQVDAFLAICGTKAKPGGISIDCGVKSPAWIYQGATGSPGVQVVDPNVGKMPLIWDAKYQKIIKNFIAQFGAHLDANANLSYVIVGGLGQLLDTLFVSATDYAAVNALAVAAGYADLLTAWTAGATAVADFWVKTMKTTTVVFALELPVPTITGGLMGLDEFVRASISRYHEQMGVATLKLDGLTSAGTGLSVNSIVRDATRNPKGFQFKVPSSNPACDPSQEPASYIPELGLRDAANAGIRLGAQYEEFYEEDILNVTSPYTTDFAQFQTDLKANIGGGGGGGSGNTIAAASPSYADVSAAVSAASDGDTVQIPAGSATWSNTLEINKPLVLQGAGSGSTVITSSLSTGLSLITLNPSSNIRIRITAIGFQLGTMKNGRRAITILGDRTGSYTLNQVRLDHLSITGGGGDAGAIQTDGWITGCIDHNTFTNTYVAIYARGDDNKVWDRAKTNGISAGTSDALFVEDNNFILNASSVVTVDAEVYIQEGANVVVRYNTFDSTAFTAVNFLTLMFNNHGNQEYINGTLGTNFRGSPIFEAYNNTAHGHIVNGNFIGIRGGSVLIHDNTMTTVTGTADPIQFSEEEDWQTAYFSPLRTAWPAQDQIFNSFIWSNTYNGSPITNIVLDEPATDATFIQQNRDYFMHAPQSSGGKETFTGTRWGGSTTAPTTSDTGSMTFSSVGANAYYPYTPYTYPHPLNT